MATHYYGRFSDPSEASESTGSEKRKRNRVDDNSHRPLKPKLAKDVPIISKITEKRKRDHNEDDLHRPQKPKVVAQPTEEVKKSKKRSVEEPEENRKKRVKIPDNIDFPQNDENHVNPISFRKATVERDSDEENAERQLPHNTQPETTPACTLSMYNYTLALLKSDVKKKCEQARKSRVLEKWEYARLASANDVECEGDMRCRLMDEAIAFNVSKGLELSPAQNVCVRGHRITSYAQYYGDSIQFHLPRLLAQNGCSEFHSEMLIFMARRQGKTTLISLLCACELVTQPLGHDICVYSNNGRASRLFLMMMYKFVRILSSQEAGFGGQIKNLNKNEGMSYTTRWGTINKATAFPAEEQNLRGTGSTETTGTVIIDEINYCHPSMVNNIIAPTLVRKRVKFIGITTISGFDSFVTPLANARYPDGRKVMLTLNFEMVCEDCKAKGEPEKCKCLMADLPHWHLSTQLEKLEILLANNLDTYMREMKNLASDSSISSAFNPKDVAYLRRPECILRMTEITASKVFVSIDPACGGDKSRMAIVSAIYVDNEMIIVGAESFHATGMHAPTLHSDVVVRHVAALREVPGLKGADIIIVPESNSGFDSQIYCLALQKSEITRVFVMDEDTKHVGIRSTNSSKKRMAILMSLALQNKMVKFHPLMVCTAEEFTAEDMRNLIIQQLSDFKCKMKMQKARGEDDGEPRWVEIYSGKFGGRKDDHAMGMMINYIGHVVYIQKYDEIYRDKKPLY